MDDSDFGRLFIVNMPPMRPLILRAAAADSAWEKATRHKAAHSSWITCRSASLVRLAGLGQSLPKFAQSELGQDRAASLWITLQVRGHRHATEKPLIQHRVGKK